MKRTSFAVAFSLMLHISSTSAQETLQGDEKLACEALLCLSTSTRPAECTPSLRRYFSISYKKFSDTLRGRMNFLNMCPVVTANMAAYKSAVINGSPFGVSGTISTMSCYKCGQHKSRALGTFKRILGQSMFMCAECAVPVKI